MIIFFVGIALIVIGALLSYVGARIHKASVRGTPVDPFYAWFLEIAKKAFTTLTDPMATGGQRIAAMGSLLLGLGILASAVGLIAWAAS